MLLILQIDFDVNVPNDFAFEFAGSAFVGKWI